ALARAPGERREVAVVPAGRVVPVDAEGVQVAARGLRERQAPGSRVADVVEVDRLVLLGPRDPLDGDVEHTWNRDRAAHAAPLDRGRFGLSPPQTAGEQGPRRHRAARS